MNPLAALLISPALLSWVIYGSLVLTGLGAVVLGVLFYKDWKNDQLW